MHGVVIGRQLARSRPRRPGQNRYYQERASHRNEVLEHRNDKIRNLEDAHQPGAHPIPRKRSYYTADRTQTAADRSRLPASQRHGRVRESAQEDPRNQARRLRARRRRWKLIRHKLDERKNREGRHGSRRPHKRQRAALKVEPATMRRPSNHRRSGERAQARDKADAEGKKQYMRGSHAGERLPAVRVCQCSGACSFAFCSL